MDALMGFSFVVYILCSVFIWLENSNKKILWRIFFALFPMIWAAIDTLKIVFEKASAFYKTITELKRFELELPYFIESVRSCLKAGLCLDNALEYAAHQPKWGEKLQVHMKAVVAERDSGRAMFDCLNHMKSMTLGRLEYRHFNVFLTSLLVGYQSGGDLVHLLEKCQRKIMNSMDLKRKVRVITAQMRFQAVVITLAPLALAIILYIFDRARIFFFSSQKLLDDSYWR